MGERDMKKKKIAVFSLIFLLTFVVIAAFAAEQTQKVINYSNGSAPPVLEPIMRNYRKTSYLIYNLFCGLARIGKNGIPELAYAESYEISKDGLEYTFKIRKDAKFSDGSPLTAHDWENSFKYRISPEIASPGIDLYLFVKNAQAYNNGKAKASDVGIKALDDTTLRIVFENKTPFFMDLICYYIPYKLDVVKTNPEWHKEPKTYIGNGAFRVKKLDPQTGLLLEKNPHYFDADNGKIDIVNYNFIDDDSIGLAAYRNGDINVNNSLNMEAIKAYKDTPEFKSFPRINTAYLSVNTANIPDVRVRKAMSLAINRKVLVNNILGMSYIPAEGVIPYGIHWGDKEFREVAGNILEENLEKAKKLLEDAGYPGGKGLKAIRIICFNSQSSIDTCQALQAMWKQIGINSEITSYETSVYWDIIDTDTWDVADNGWTGDYDDPKTFFHLWQANMQGADKDLRWYNTSNAKQFDSLVKAVDVEIDGEKRFNIYKQAEVKLLDDMPVIPLWHGNDTVLIKPEVSDIVKSNVGHIYFHYADVNIK
jgi:oligopeptide transport system substrate-binding protein